MFENTVALITGLIISILLCLLYDQQNGNHALLRQKNTAIIECEKELPRNQNCIFKIVAYPDVKQDN